jgi:hypothetical protein
MTENWRVKMARFFAGTDLPPFGPFPFAAAAGFAASIRVT